MKCVLTPIVPLAVALLVVPPQATSGAELVLVSNGKAHVPIVVHSKPAPAAATDLQQILQKISGAAPEIVTIERWNQRTPTAPAIYMACVPAKAPQHASEEWSRVEVRSDGVFFHVNPRAPPSIQAVALQQAVNCFAQRALGCRWLMPGELGEVIPKRKTIALSTATLEQNPRFWRRRIRDEQTRFGGKEPLRQRALAALQLNPADPALLEAEKNMGAAEWLNRMNTGERFPFAFGHNFGGWWEKYGKTHPEYFALQPDGTRTQRPPRERLCESEPRLWEQVAANVIAAFDADPNLKMYSICENDGALRNKFCMCARCMALDPPEAPKVKDPKIYDPKTGQPFPDGYPALTDRVFTFFNEVARRVKEKHPDRYLGAYAYSAYSTPPVRLKKIEDNIVVSLVSDEPANLQGWSKVASNLFIRPNRLGDPKTFGMARNDARRLGRFIQTTARYNVLGHDWPGLYGNWATQGLNYYVVAMMLWDPMQDIEALIEDYIRAAYGEQARPAMRRYFDKLEALTDELLSNRAYAAVRAKSNPEPLLAHYTDARLAELERCLTEAHRATTPESPERRRVELNMLGLEYTRHVCQLIASIRESCERKPFEAEWRKYAPTFASLVRNRYFGVVRNLSTLLPALRKIQTGDSSAPSVAPTQ
ncbi:MAG: DUF4838 domain-containing protein [Verrucomicrobiae bacterium]|nr:DUF4838 domain-containing protein [Verrucomicrobiae bacterium]